jgi:hypothetical protein
MRIGEDKCDWHDLHMGITVTGLFDIRSLLHMDTLVLFVLSLSVSMVLVMVRWN